MPDILTNTTKVVDILKKANVDPKVSSDDGIVMIIFDPPATEDEGFAANLQNEIENAKTAAGCQGNMIQRNGRFSIRFWFE